MRCILQYHMVVNCREFQTERLQLVCAFWKEKKPELLTWRCDLSSFLSCYSTCGMSHDYYYFLILHGNQRERSESHKRF
eukprot:g35477.t1